MVFCMPQKKVVIPRLKIANAELDSVDRFNFLGVLLDKHLSWDAHTNALVGKIYRTTGIDYSTDLSCFYHNILSRPFIHL